MKKLCGRIFLLVLLTCLCTVNVAAAQSSEQAFAANFKKTVIYDLNELVAAFDGLHGNGLTETTDADASDFGNATYIIDVGDYDIAAYCKADPHDGDMGMQLVGARVRNPKYQAAGLHLGAKFGPKEAAAFAHNMYAMGWGPGGDAAPRAYRWRQVLPTKTVEFCVRAQNERIVDIIWVQHLQTASPDCACAG